MKHPITIETALIIAKYGMIPTSCWPPPPGSSNVAILQQKICSWIGIINLSLTIASYSLNVYENRRDPVRIITNLTDMSAMMTTLTKMIICKIEAPHLQDLLNQMKNFLRQATSEEKKVMQKYVDKCRTLHTMVIFIITVGPIIFIAAPLLTSEPLPGHATYPFPTEATWVWIILYISQSICIIQVASMVVLDIMFGILLWYAGARFEMLAMELRAATNALEMSLCARKHHELIEYVDELRKTTRIIAVEVTVVAVFAVTVGGFILVTNPPLYEGAKYALFEVASALELFLFAWPADNLIDVSQKIGDAAFDCDWIGKSSRMHKDVLIIIQRSRNPIIIAVNGVVPALSLEFYGSSMAATFSYLTTLRVITGAD